MSINETIIERLEEVRGLDLLFPVETVFIDKKELEKEYMEKKEDKTDELILKALFMMDPDANLHLIESKYNSECVMAYYTPEEKKIVIVEEYENLLDEIFPHEYTTELYEKGGWKEVNRAFINPPSTTE
ncbi:MAG: hypothetical protein ACXQT5_07640 [Candidatus Syntropharchaeia archaeon]